MMIKGIIKTVLLAQLMLVPLASHALLLVDFEITNTPLTAGPSDSLTINGRLTNALGSDENLTTLNGAAYSPGALFGIYQFSFGIGGNFFNQFSGINLAPGSSFDFIFGDLTPVTSPVAEGTYTSSEFTFSFSDSQGVQQNITSQNLFSVTVRNQAIPLPGTLALFGLGLAGLGMVLKRNVA